MNILPYTAAATTTTTTTTTTAAANNNNNNNNNKGNKYFAKRSCSHKTVYYVVCLLKLNIHLHDKYLHVTLTTQNYGDDDNDDGTSSQFVVDTIH
jgi:hypothetical protein